MEAKTQNHLTLKWGTLKSWDFTNSEKGQELLKEYLEIGSSFTAMGQEDTPRQKEIICKLIDLCDGDIYLAWEGKTVTKQEAKRYVMNFGMEENAQQKVNVLKEDLKPLIDQYFEENLIGKFSDEDGDYVKEIIRDFVQNYL